MDLFDPHNLVAGLNETISDDMHRRCQDKNQATRWGQEQCDEHVMQQGLIEVCKDVTSVTLAWDVLDVDGLDEPESS